MNAADQLLRDLFAGTSEVPGAVVIDAARQAGIPETNLRRAARRLGYRIERRGLAERGGTATAWIAPTAPAASTGRTAAPSASSGSSNPRWRERRAGGPPYGGARRPPAPATPRVGQDGRVVGWPEGFAAEPDPYASSPEPASIWRWTGPGRGPDRVPLARGIGICADAHGEAVPAVALTRLDGPDLLPGELLYAAECAACIDADRAPVSVGSRMAAIFAADTAAA